MSSFFDLARLMSWRNRMEAYRQARRDAEAMSNADLADIGLKRYQLGHVARTKALK